MPRLLGRLQVRALGTDAGRLLATLAGWAARGAAVHLASALVAPFLAACADPTAAAAVRSPVRVAAVGARSGPVRAQGAPAGGVVAPPRDETSGTSERYDPPSFTRGPARCCRSSSSP
jgi:hypothetical protein